MDRGQADDLSLAGTADHLRALHDRIGELEGEIAQLREALVHRRRYGVVTGMVAVRYEITPEQAWHFLVRLSQQSNLKMQVVTRIIHDRTFGRLTAEDEALAARLDPHLQGSLRQLVPGSEDVHHR